MCVRAVITSTCDWVARGRGRVMCVRAVITNTCDWVASSILLLPTTKAVTSNLVPRIFAQDE